MDPRAAVFDPTEQKFVKQPTPYFAKGLQTDRARMDFQKEVGSAAASKFLEEVTQIIKRRRDNPREARYEECFNGLSTIAKRHGVRFPVPILKEADLWDTWVETRYMG